MSWLVLKYRPSSLFSLRSSLTTSSGGKTLLVPTPYSFKLALIDAAYRVGGETTARNLFNLVAQSIIRIKPPKELVVNHTFVKIKRKPKNPAPETPYISSIGFREFVYYKGDLHIGIQADSFTEKDRAFLELIGAHINYLGKRGSFMQFLGTETLSSLGKDFTIRIDAEQLDSADYAVVQHLDDIGGEPSKELFERLNSFRPEKSIKLGVHRNLVPTFLPYRLVESSAHYSRYKRPTES